MKKGRSSIVVVIMTSLMFTIMSFGATAMAASGTKTLDNDPAVGSAVTDYMSSSTPAFFYYPNQTYSYSGDHRLAMTPGSDYRYTWYLNVATSSWSKFSAKVYLRNTNFSNQVARYYVNGQYFTTINQDKATNGWNNLNTAMNPWDLQAFTTLSVSSKDSSGLGGSTGADAVQVNWY